MLFCHNCERQVEEQVCEQRPIVDEGWKQPSAETSQGPGPEREERLFIVGKSRGHESERESEGGHEKGREGCNGKENDRQRVKEEEIEREERAGLFAGAWGSSLDPLPALEQVSLLGDLEGRRQGLSFGEGETDPSYAEGQEGCLLAWLAHSWWENRTQVS